LLQHCVARDAGVVDQHLDGPDLVFDVDDPLLAGGVIAHVPFEDRDLGVLLEGLGGHVVAGVVDGDVVTGLLQRLGDRAADAARTSCDQSHPSHASPPLRKRFFAACFDSKPIPPRSACEDTNEIRTSSGTDQSRSTHMAMPMPPPMQSVARPFLASRFCISCNNVVRMRAPEAPIGWPMAMAPPFTLTLPVSQPRSLFTASAWAARASLVSTRSGSPIFQPAFFSALREAGIGPEPMTLGSTPAVAQEAMRASGFKPRFLASFAVISTTAAAPSLMPDALPAVTVPSLSKAGLSFAASSTLAPSRIYSSSETTVSPLRVLTVTGTISSLNLPAFLAASALFCEAVANLSCSSRVICHWRATFSAVL